MMKKIFPALAIFFAAAVGANATILLQDNFSGTNGPLVGTTPDVGGIWTNHSGAVDEIQIVSNQVVLTDAGSEDANSSFTTTSAGNVFYSFDFSLADPGSYTGTDYEYFAHFKDAGTSNFVSRLDVAGFSASGFRLGISNTSTADATWATELSYATSFNVIVGYNFTSGISTLWVNATSIGDTNITSASVLQSDIEGFAFRQSSATPNQDLTIENLIVATTFNEVAVPEPTACALFGAGALFWVLRRKRAA